MPSGRPKGSKTKREDLSSEEDFHGLPGVEEITPPVKYRVKASLYLEEVVDTLAEGMNYPKEKARRIVDLFFSEVRVAILNGHIVRLKHLGALFVKRPASPHSNLRVKIVFNPYETLDEKFLDTLDEKSLDQSK